MSLSITTFKRVLVAFWAIWWLIAFLSDVAGGLKELGLITANWLPHTSYPTLVEGLASYSAPGWLAPFLFVGIICWSFLSAVLLTVAALTPIQPWPRWQRRVDSAFIVSLSLWLAFFLADQIIMKFGLEENHMVQGGFQLLCLLAIHLLSGDRYREG